MHIRKLFAISLLVLGYSAFSQDNPTSLRAIDGALICRDTSNNANCKTIRTRILGGPMMSYVFSPNKGDGKGMLLGAMVGLEWNFRISQNGYLIGGANLNSSKHESWLVSNDGSYVSINALSVEIPIGIGFTYGKNLPRGFFTNVSFVNSLTLGSSATYHNLKAPGVQVGNNIKRPEDFYNFGAKLEFGHKGLLHEKYYTSFSGVVKPIFMNMSNSDSRYGILNLAIIGSIYL